MSLVTCPGWPGAWINGWLAAVGTTVLDARIRLHWTTDGVPLAVLSASEVDPVAALVESWPDAALLADLPIAENWKGAGKVRRTVPVEAFAGRARVARGHPNAWTLSSTMTDLCVDEHGEVAHAPFDPAGPGDDQVAAPSADEGPRTRGTLVRGDRPLARRPGRPGEGQRIGIRPDPDSARRPTTPRGGSIPSSRSSRSSDLPSSPCGASVATGSWTASPTCARDREGGSRRRGVADRDASIGQLGVSRSTAAASMLSLTSGAPRRGTPGRG